MKQTGKAALAALLMLAIAIFPGMTAARAEGPTATAYYFVPEDAVASTTNLPHSFLIGDSEGIRVGVDGLYYIHAKGVVPGDVFTKRLTIQNLEMAGDTRESEIPYTLTMRAEPLFSMGPVDLLDVVHLELKLDGQILYSGRCRGDEGVNMIEAPLFLGIYKPGYQRTLDIKLTVSGGWELSREISVAEFKWIFYAWREMESEPPKTGVAEYSALILLGAAIPLFWFLLVVKKKKRQAREAAM